MHWIQRMKERLAEQDPPLIGSLKVLFRFKKNVYVEKVDVYHTLFFTIRSKIVNVYI